MVTVQEASDFLLKQLKFHNWQNVIREDKLKFLQLLVPYYAHNNYFQNISLSSIAAEDRKFPDEEDIIRDGLNGVGGTCITQNGFLMLLLKALDFDAFIVASTVQGQGYAQDNHVLCIVRLTPDQLYLFDMGVTFPFAEPVPLHDLPHFNRAAGCRYCYKKAENGLYIRTQLDGALFGGDYEDKDTEFVRYDFTLEPKTLEFFRKPLKSFFVEPTESDFLKHPYLFRYFNENEDGDLIDQAQLTGNRKFIHIRGVSVLIADDDTKMVKHLSDYNELKETIGKYFPKLNETAVDKSLLCFNENTTDSCYKVVSARTY